MYWMLFAAAAAQEFANNKEREARIRSIRGKLMEVRSILGNDFFNSIVMDSGHENGFDSIVAIEKVIDGLETIAVTKDHKVRVSVLITVIKTYESDCTKLITSLIEYSKGEEISDIKKMLVSKIVVELKMLKKDIDDARAYVTKKTKSRRNGWIAFWIILGVVVFAFSFAMIMLVVGGHSSNNN